MDKLHGNTWIIHNEEEFFENCEIAQKIMDYVKNKEDTQKVQWFFDLCYANWKEKKFNVLFKSWKTPGFENYQLSVEAFKKEKGNWMIRTIKKIAE